MNTKYREYLSSSKWLIKKAEMVNLYVEQGWSIQCAVCGSEKDLQVHHENYDTLYDEEVMDLLFLCKVCHKKMHLEEGFRDAWLKREVEKLIKVWGNNIIN